MNMRPLQHGFTLIELMVTIAILAILTAIAYPSYATYMQRQRIENTRANMTRIIHHAEKVYARRGTFCEVANPCGFDNTEIAKLTDDDSRYTIAQTVEAGSFTLLAEPRAGLYSDSTLSSTNLNILYDSTTANFARCNTAGFNAVKANNDPGDENCEIF